MSEEKLEEQEATEQPPGDEQTKAELYEQAKDADIEGRSSMDKEELADAIDTAAHSGQAKAKGPVFERNPEGGPLITK